MLTDLYYHLQGELIGPGPFKELSWYLVESNCLLSYQHKYGDEHYGKMFTCMSSCIYDQIWDCICGIIQIGKLLKQSYKQCWSA
ncbi:hypothetical protein Peur_052262 [Populus x canadensis]